MEKRLKKIEETLGKIEKRLNTNIIDKANKYDEMISLLKEIEIETISSVEIDENTGEKYVKVEYHIPTAKVMTNDEGDIECPKHFRAINLLNLLTISDISKISNEIEIIKKFNK